MPAPVTAEAKFKAAQEKAKLTGVDTLYPRGHRRPQLRTDQGTQGVL